MNLRETFIKDDLQTVNAKNQSYGIYMHDHLLFSQQKGEAEDMIKKLSSSGIFFKENVISNACKFLNLLRNDCGITLKRQDISYTTYGNIVVDLNTPKGLISIEIGSEHLGFFTEYKTGVNYASDGIKTDFNSIPEYLYNTIIDAIKYDKAVG